MCKVEIGGQNKWKVEIGGSKQVESGNWWVKKRKLVGKNVENGNCEMKWKV